MCARARAHTQTHIHIISSNVFLLSNNTILFCNSSIQANVIYYTSPTITQYRCRGFSVSSSIFAARRHDARRRSHHPPLASPYAREKRTAPRGWCRLREGVGPFNFTNRRRVTRRKTGEVIVGNMRETFNLSHSKQALATPPPSPLRRARFFHSDLFLLLLLLIPLPPSLLSSGSHVVFASASQRNLFAILKRPESSLARNRVFGTKTRFSFSTLLAQLGPASYFSFSLRSPKFISRYSFLMSFCFYIVASRVFIKTTFLILLCVNHKVIVVQSYRSNKLYRVHVLKLNLYKEKAKHIILILR